MLIERRRKEVTGRDKEAHIYKYTKYIEQTEQEQSIQ